MLDSGGERVCGEGRRVPGVGWVWGEWDTIQPGKVGLYLG